MQRNNNHDHHGRPRSELVEALRTIQALGRSRSVPARYADVEPIPEPMARPARQQDEVPRQVEEIRADAVRRSAEATARLHESLALIRRTWRHGLKTEGRTFPVIQGGRN